MVIPLLPARAVRAEIPCGPSTLLMGQRSPSFANEQEARYSGVQHNEDPKGSSFRLSTGCLSVGNSSSLKEGRSLAGRGHARLDTGFCNPLNLHWTGVGLFKSQTSFWCRDRGRALELHSRFSSAEILKQFIPWSGCCWVCWSCPFFLLQLKNYSWRRN